MPDKYYRYVAYCKQVTFIVNEAEDVKNYYKQVFSILQPKAKTYPATRHVFVKHGCPRRQQMQIVAKSLGPKF